MLRKWMLALCFCLGIFGCGCSETTSNKSNTTNSEAVTATTQSADEKQLGICLQWILTSH